MRNDNRRNGEAHGEEMHQYGLVPGETIESDIADWSERIAVLGPERFMQAIHDRVRAVNRIDMDAMSRLRTLELLRPMARQALDCLADRLQSHPIPLTGTGKRMFGMIIDFLDAIALGYDIVAVEAKDVAGREQVALALERELALRGERLLRLSQNYMAPTDSCWRDIHGAYRTACETGVADLLVEDSELEVHSCQSPRSMYKRILLFILAETGHLPRDDMACLYRILENWEARTSLEKGVSPASMFSQFGVDLTSSEPPCQLKNMHITDKSEIRILLVDDLLQHVQGLRNGSLNERDCPGEGLPSHETLEHVLDSLWLFRCPRGERTRHEREVDVNIGLHQVHARMIAEGSVPTPDGGDSVSHNEPYMDGTGHDVLQEVGKMRDGARRENVRNNSATGERGNRDSNDGLHVPPPGMRSRSQWLLQDISTSGMRLRWNGGEIAHVAVGELVAVRLIRSVHSIDDWCLGIVRRIQFVDDARFDLGIHLIARMIIAASIGHVDDRHGAGHFSPDKPALLLPYHGIGDVYVSAVVPAGVFRPGDTVELGIDGRVERLELGECREETRVFNRFLLMCPHEGSGHSSPMPWGRLDAESRHEIRSAY